MRAFAEKDGRGYPDWAMRYLPVVRRFGRRVFREHTVLEIGANENGIARFVETHVVAVDIVRAAEGRDGHRAQEHVLEQSKAQRLKCADDPPRILAIAANCAMIGCPG